MVSKRNLLFQGLLFRFHLKFQGCTWVVVSNIFFFTTIILYTYREMIQFDEHIFSDRLKPPTRYLCMVYEIWYYIFHVGKWYFTCRKRKTCDRYWIVNETNMSSMSWIYFHMPWLLLGNGTSPMPTQQEKVWSSALLCLFFSDVCWEPSFSQRIVMTLPCFF